MDRDTFDGLARFAAAASRRSALRAAVGGALRLPLAVAAPRPAAGKGCKPLLEQCKRRRQCCGADGGRSACGLQPVCAPFKFCCRTKGESCPGDDCACCGDLVCDPESNRCRNPI